MKTIFLIASLTAFSSFAGPIPPPQQQQQQQQQQQCGQCTPSPREYLCYAQMLDCYGRPLYTYWARGPRYDGACQFASQLCQRDASMGYGGYGARCMVLGK